MSDSKAQTFKRDNLGRLKETQKITLNWNGQLITSISSANEQLKLVLNPLTLELLKSCDNKNGCLEKLDGETFLINGKIVTLIKIDGENVGIALDDKFYPVITDYLGSVVAMVANDSLVWVRSYSDWGIKNVTYAASEEAQDLEKLCPWSFAGLMELPQLTDSSIYFSQSRAYLPHAQEWANIDPLLLESPKSLQSSIGNFYPTRYANNDPVNFVDPSGYASMLANYERRKEINNSIISKGIKTATSLAIGGFYSVAARKELGLGVGIGELYRNSMNVATLGRMGTLGNFALSAGIKTAGVGASFAAGQYIGNVIGAVIDTYVDNNSGSFLENLGFGSGQYNTTKESLFDFEVMNPFNGGGMNPDNYSMGDYNFETNL